MRIEYLAESDSLVRKARLNRGVFPGADKTHPDLRRWWFTLQDAAADHGIPLRVVWGFRTRREQAEMVRRGVTRARPGSSAHNYGLALDVIHMRRAWADMPAEGWELLGVLGKEAARRANVAVEWGGDWERDKRGGLGWDAAHWQIAKWRTFLADRPEWSRVVG